jgi:hypothetical protein
LAWFFILALVLFHMVPVLWNLPVFFQKLVNLEPTNGQPGWTQAEMQAAVRAFGLSSQVFGMVLFASSLACLLCFWVMTGLLLWLKRNSWVGLLSAFVLSGIGVGFAFFIPETSSWPAWARWLFDFQALLIWSTFFLLLYLFPDGRFAPGWTRFLAPLPFAVFILASVYENDSAPAWLIGLLLVYAVGGVASQIYRYRRVSGPEQRQQTKWVVLWMGVFLPILVFGLLEPLFIPTAKTPARFLYDVGLDYLLSVFLSALLPVAIGFSILRYRLWDIDLIIRKTLIYGLLSAALGLVFFGGVALLQGLFTALTGQESPAALVLSTLLIAALFNPLRRRVQEFIDRRFYRSKYNAGQTLAAFAETARSQVDLPALSQALARAADESLKPQAVSLWLKPQAGSRPEER